MSKNARATIPPPRFTLPTAAEPTAIDVAQQQTIQAAPVMSVVPPAVTQEEPLKPRREIVADGILFHSPTIELSEHIFIRNGEQTKKLTPETALVTNGVLLVDELEIAVPLSGVSVIRLLARSPHVHPKR